LFHRIKKGTRLRAEIRFLEIDRAGGGVERSTTLAAGWWTVLEAAFPETAGTATYTDPSPPAGKAFDRIKLKSLIRLRCSLEMKSHPIPT
jgi:hypothetical protein